MRGLTWPVTAAAKILSAHPRIRPSAHLRAEGEQLLNREHFDATSVRELRVDDCGLAA
ncbi:hypothetical protein [Streptomyces sp. SID3343]|uniref:hypothetical protein n=1 Tax=Streptomyces sp. SID3343 TaxID=2690260 RepID=UPI0019296E91|nr:hypothetical protein [Streptomyces sp. SID3343]